MTSLWIEPPLFGTANLSEKSSRLAEVTNTNFTAAVTESERSMEGTLMSEGGKAGWEGRKGSDKGRGNMTRGIREEGESMIEKARQKTEDDG